MTFTSYDEAAARAASTPAGEHIAGPPGPGLIVLWIGWPVVAALMTGLGGAVFAGILQAVTASG